MNATSSALSVREVSYRYSRHAPLILDRVSLEVQQGGAVGLVGESGSGKSTLARILVGERRPTTGEALVNGIAWSTVKRSSALRRGVQMIFQDPYAALNPYLTPRAAVSEAARITQGISRDEAAQRARSLLGEVGLSGALIDRSPNRLSGGQRQRVVIARALACEPSVLVADEPTSALDVSVQAQILNLLMQIQAERRLTLVLISHDIAVINHVTEEVAVMAGGRIVEAGPTESVLTDPQAE